MKRVLLVVALVLSLFTGLVSATAERQALSVTAQLSGPLADEAIILVIGYDKDDRDSWKIFDPSAPSYANDLESLRHGWGYWIKVSKPYSLRLPSGVFVPLQPGWNLVGWMDAPTPTATPVPPTPTPVLPTPTPTPTATPRPAVTQVFFGQDVTEQEKQQVWDAIRSFEQFLLQSTGLKVEGVTVYASHNSAFLIESYERHYGRPASDLMRVTIENNNGIMGDCGSRVIFVNLSNVWPGQIQRNGTLQHELFHVLQSDLSGCGNFNSVARWLMEGPATAIEGLMVAEAGLDSFQEIRQRLISQARQAPSLDSLEGPETMNSDNAESRFALAGLASHLLIEQKGINSVISFWRLVGEGKTWQTAFREAFGKEVGTFYEEFRQYRLANGF